MRIIVYKQIIIDKRRAAVKSCFYIFTKIESFKEIVSEVSNIGSKIKAVNDLTENINNEKTSMLGKVEEISAVSASSEEIAALSEKMNASSDKVAATAHTLASKTDDMNKKVSKFKI